MNPLLMTDGYKTSHVKMYPEKTEYVFNNFTPRSVKFMHPKAKDIVVVGIVPMLQHIYETWDINFFKKDKKEVITEAKEYFNSYLGCNYDMSHFEKLHDLGYLPIHVRALPEGSVVAQNIPILTVINTKPDFYWLPNFLETFISSNLWKMLHSASIAYAFKKIVRKFATETDIENIAFTDFQCHDFSARGMQSMDAAMFSGIGFLSCFKGTDTIISLQAVNKFYGDKNVGFSVPASEHSVMTAYGKDNEIASFERLLLLYPTGILSVVSDTWDLWKVCSEFLPALKDKILARNGKLVIRPDSGDPVDIICGSVNPAYRTGIAGKNRTNWTPEEKGVIELLWDTFGGTINEQGFKVLDSHIGLIYGDSITLDNCEEICEKLKTKGFASTNIVFGVGSYSLGYATRDSQGCAVKSTFVIVNGQPLNIFKDPITDNGVKKSARGLLRVVKKDNKFELEQECSFEDLESKENCLKTVYLNKRFYNHQTFEEIRNNINNQI